VRSVRAYNATFSLRLGGLPAVSRESSESRSKLLYDVEESWTSEEALALVLAVVLVPVVATASPDAALSVAALVPLLAIEPNNASTSESLSCEADGV